MDLRIIARILGGRAVLKREVRSLADLHQVVTAGLPVRALSRTAEYVGTTPREVAHLKDSLVPPATRKRRKTVLKPNESERVERLARLMALAEEVWEDRDKAREFLRTSHPLLGDRSPLDLA
ncbi:MAG: antitoxin Xre-like helix-turn-helix domain-containing protein, partial [Acidimicrobiia bacterium]